MFSSPFPVEHQSHNHIQGVELDILLMIILPPLVQFNLSLSDVSALPRNRTAKSTQYVSTLSDFQTLLMQMTAGYMPKLVFVLPIDAHNRDTDHEDERKPEVWLASELVLGRDNCHWVI